MMDDRLFRTAMGKFATGITVVTSDYHGEIHGMTVNAFMSVSLNPKLITVSIDEKASMYETLQEVEQFGVSILSENQQDISMIFAKQKEKDREIPYTYLDGAPVLENSLAVLSCKPQQIVKAGDHILIIAEVSDIQVNEGDPLLYFNGQYRNIPSK
jgi:flavin reductase (DIM6/NTAB) family NADH-FMN oxidoreductase RutF